MKERKINVRTETFAGVQADAGKNGVTIYDIARFLGKSTSTVSRGLNGHKTVKTETVRKIRETAKKMGYVANNYAKHLKINSNKSLTDLEHRPVTIYDVAKKLHLSAATVSRAFSPGKSIKPATKVRVLNKAAAMGFTMQDDAHQLRAKRFCTIGVFLMSLDRSSVAILLAGIKEAAALMRFDVLIADTQAGRLGITQKKHNLIYGKCDGVIVIPGTAQLNDHFFETLQYRKPVICLGSGIKNILVTCIGINHFEAVFEMTAYLIACGCRKVWFIDAQGTGTCYNERLAGYRHALETHALRCDKIFYSAKWFSHGATISQFYKGLPDGILIIGTHDQIIEKRAMLAPLFNLQPNMCCLVFNTGLPGEGNQEAAGSNILVDHYESGRLVTNKLIDQIRFGSPVHDDITYLPHRLDV